MVSVFPSSSWTTLMQVACAVLKVSTASENSGPLEWEVSKNSWPKKEVTIEEGLVCFYSPWRRNNTLQKLLMMGWIWRQWSVPNSKCVVTLNFPPDALLYCRVSSGEDPLANGWLHKYTQSVSTLTLFSTSFSHFINFHWAEIIWQRLEMSSWPW